MTNDTNFSVCVADLSWTLRSAEATANAAPAARPIMSRRHRAAAATVASVNRGTT
jgi:hypothetical protein